MIDQCENQITPNILNILVSPSSYGLLCEVHVGSCYICRCLEIKLVAF